MKLLQLLLECIYPPCCPLCHQIIAPRGQLICSSCREHMAVLAEPRCKQCSKPLISWEREYCFDCEHRQHHFTEGFAVFPYNLQMQKSIVYFKFHGRKEYGRFYGEVLGHGAAGVIGRWQPQVLIPVPIHKKKQRERGFNQAEVIGSVLSRRFSIPIRTDLIERIKDTKAQKELTSKERKNNLKNAFRASKGAREYQRVLLVDDIYTTGSTVDAITRELKKWGVEQVYFVAVCIGGSF